MVDKKKTTSKPADKASIAIKADLETVSVSRLNMNIYQKLAAITGRVAPIAKDGQNSEQHYKFIEYAAVAGELRGLFAEYGVVIVPNMPASADQNRKEFKTSRGGVGVAILMDFKFDVINADQPDDRFTVSWTGEATDYGDKGTNKAATAALKYYLMRQFNISEKGEQEADAASPERPAYQEPAYTPEPAVTVTERPPVPMITLDQQDALSELLSTKGMYDSADQKALVLKMAKTNDILAINEASANAILNRIEGAAVEALYAFIGKEQPKIDENEINIDDDEPTDGDGTEATDIDIGDAPDPIADAPTSSPVDEAYKQKVMASLDALGLKPQERMRLLKDATGAVTNKNLSESQWRDFSNAVDDYAIELADGITQKETPQADSDDNEGNTKSGGDLDGAGTTADDQGGAQDVAEEA